jgi:hypothetical protein
MDRRFALVVVAIVVVAALFFVFRPESDDGAAPAATTPTSPPSSETLEPPPTTTAAPEPIPWRIETDDDRIDRLRAPRDAEISITVAADVSDHVHVHGYDLMADVAPGSPATIAFRATITGRFEIELEDSGQEIAQLTVVP